MSGNAEIFILEHQTSKLLNWVEHEVTEFHNNSYKAHKICLGLFRNFPRLSQIDSWFILAKSDYCKTTCGKYNWSLYMDEGLYKVQLPGSLLVASTVHQGCRSTPCQLHTWLGVSVLLHPHRGTLRSQFLCPPWFSNLLIQIRCFHIYVWFLIFARAIEY